MEGRLLLVLIYMTTSLVHVHGSVLDMCQGSFGLPQIIYVIVTPILDDLERITGVTVRAEMTSKAPLNEIDWVYQKDMIRASEGQSHFRHSTVVFADRHIFSMELKLGESVEKLNDITRDLLLQATVTFHCNVGMLTWGLIRLMDIAKNNIKSPTITQMPRKRYITDEKVIFDVKLCVTDDSKEPHGPSMTCRHRMHRKAGRLDWAKVSLYDDNFFGTTTFHKDTPGRTESVCKYDMQGDLEVIYAALEVEIWISRHDTYSLNIPFELRRPGVVKPAVMVTAAKYIPSGGLYIAINKDDDVDSWCMADAETRPTVSMGIRRKKSGKFEMFPVAQLDSPYLSRGDVRINFKSPKPGEEDEYICSAANGMKVDFRTFKVIGYEKVRIAAADMVTMKPGKMYDLTCEASGVPQPQIVFHWSPTYPAYLMSNTTEYMQKNQAHAITDSEFITAKTWEKAGKAYGRVIVQDVKEVIKNLPNHPTITPKDLFESYMHEADDHAVFNVVCFAYHDFASSYKTLGRYGNRTSGLLDDLFWEYHEEINDSN